MSTNYKEIEPQKVSYTMPINEYQKVNLSDYNRKLDELEERRTSGAGLEL